MLISVVRTTRERLGIWLEEFRKSGYRCKEVADYYECRRKINEIMEHKVLILLKEFKVYGYTDIQIYGGGGGGSNSVRQ
jgi:hypothetical protein